MCKSKSRTRRHARLPEAFHDPSAIHSCSPLSASRWCSPRRPARSCCREIELQAGRSWSRSPRRSCSWKGLLQANFRGLDKNLRQPPADAETWTFVRGQALLIAETGNLLMLRPPKSDGQEPGWTPAAELREKATSLARAAAARDHAKRRRGAGGPGRHLQPLPPDIPRQRSGHAVRGTTVTGLRHWPLVLPGDRRYIKRTLDAAARNFGRPAANHR